MFLQYNNVPFISQVPESYEPPEQLNFIDFSTPVKSVAGAMSGPSIVASYFEALHFLTNTAVKVTTSKLQQITQNAHVLDQALENSSVDFSASDDGYVTLKSFLEASISSGLLHGTIQYTQSMNCMKQFIHKFNCCLVETYLSNAFLTQNATGKDLITFVDSVNQIKVKDYSKVFVAFGYNVVGLHVLNSLGTKWGALGFTTIAWDVLNKDVILPDGSSATCFIKAAALKGCLA